MFYLHLLQTAIKPVVAGESDRLPSNKKDGGSSRVMAFSPLEGAVVKARESGLSSESLKVRRYELSQRITYALIPVLLLVSRTDVLTSLLVFSVYWQIYGCFKEIFLDYVHHEVTRGWVLIYFAMLLVILATDTIVSFNLVWWSCHGRQKGQVRYPLVSMLMQNNNNNNNNLGCNFYF